MSNDNEAACRRMAEAICDNIADYSNHPGMRKNDIELIYDAILDRTAYPDVLGALKEVQPALSGDKRQRVNNALAKAEGK